MNLESNLSERDRAHLWHPYTQMKGAPDAIPIEYGEGVWLYTSDGRRLLDGTSSWWVNIHGHSHPKLNDALTTQAQRLEHVMFAGCTHEPAVELAERLTSILPAGLTRIFYSDNGSTAVEAALKMAWQYWQNRGITQRTEFVALHHAYHGDTFGAMSVSGESAFSKAFQPLLFPVHRADSPYLQSLERILSAHRETVAAVIVEPMLQGAGGMIVWPKESLSGVRELCNQYGALLIADEVLTGFGRTGRMFACEHAAITPDILCLSKALTAGYLPLAVTAATETIYEAFLDDDRSKAFFHGHSYTANPLGCAVAIASLKIFEEEGTLERVQTLELQFRQRLERLRNFPMVGDVRGIGGVAAIELITKDGGYLDRIGPQLAKAFLDQGLLLRPLGNIVYFMPPYAITESEVEWAFDRMEEVLQSLAPM
jgi:adenosylmethionine-8-amino-7-oxononanoate aminotransferase